MTKKKEEVEVTDHDLLMALANDMKWIKTLHTIYVVPLMLVAVKFLATWSPG